MVQAIVHGLKCSVANPFHFDPDPVLEPEKKKKNFKNIDILWASTREAYNYLQAKQLGCHIITAPPEIIEKIVELEDD